jgi:signal transduction histidine kinase
MVVQAQATGAASDNPEVKAATRQLADLGRQAMREMHATVGLLRGSEASAPLSPRPGLRELDELITRARDAGMNVGLVRRGTQRELAPTVDLCAYRIIQEALTNVRIHQPAGWTQLQVSYEPDGLLLEIVDRLPAAVAAVSTAGNDVKSGHGLVGMRERAELFGGTLTATELDDGFQVRAFLPYEAPPQ